MLAMKDLCLVIPPAPYLHQPTMYYPLGLLYIASNARKHGYSVMVDDLRDKNIKEWSPSFTANQAKVYGFTATSGEAEYVKQLSVRAPGSLVVGGAHATLCTEDYDNFFSTIVVGEGEYAILDILKGKTGIITTERIKDLDSIPFPAWDLLPYNRCFSKTLFPGERYGESEYWSATIIGSRGCPYKCDFCGNLLKAPVVYRSPGNIAEEIKYLLTQYNIGHFRFEDDDLTLNKTWLAGLCRELAQLGIQFKGHSRADLITNEDCKLLHYAGCVELGIGLETADPCILKLVHKNISPEDASKAVQYMKDNNIRSKVYLMSGLPGETWHSIHLTQQWMKENKPNKWTLARFAPYPGTAVYKDPESFHIALDSNFCSAKLWNFPNEIAFTFLKANKIDSIPKSELDDRYNYLYHWLIEEYKA